MKLSFLSFWPIKKTFFDVPLFFVLYYNTILKIVSSQRTYKFTNKKKKTTKQQNPIKFKNKISFAFYLQLKTLMSKKIENQKKVLGINLKAT